MSGEAVDIVAIITPAPGKLERAKELLGQLADKVKTEEAGSCLVYQFYAQYDAEDGNNKIIVIEKYANPAAYAAHSQTAHFGEAIKVATEESLLAGPLDIKKIKSFAGYGVKH